MIEACQQPAPDWKRDAKLIEDLYSPSGEIVSLEQDNELPTMLDRRKELSEQKSAADKELKEIKAQLLLKLGGASAGQASDGRIITAKEVHRAGYEVAPSSYIDVRVKAA
jgi:hypothetical protein